MSESNQNIVAMVDSLPEHKKAQILTNVLWEVFGVLNDDGDRLICVPERDHNEICTSNLIDILREEFFPWAREEVQWD